MKAVSTNTRTLVRAALIAALYTVLTLLLVSKPMFDKLDRVKIKYGLAEGSDAV